MEEMSINRYLPAIKKKMIVHRSDDFHNER